MTTRKMKQQEEDDDGDQTHHQYVLGFGYNFFYPLTDATIPIAFDEEKEPEEQETRGDVDHDNSSKIRMSGSTPTDVVDLPTIQSTLVLENDDDDDDNYHHRPLHNIEEPLAPSVCVHGATFPILPSCEAPFAAAAAVDKNESGRPSTPESFIASSSCTAFGGLTSLVGQWYNHKSKNETHTKEDKSEGKQGSTATSEAVTKVLQPQDQGEKQHVVEKKVSSSNNTTNTKESSQPLQVSLNEEEQQPQQQQDSGLLSKKDSMGSESTNPNAIREKEEEPPLLIDEEQADVSSPPRRSTSTTNSHDQEDDDDKAEAVVQLKQNPLLKFPIPSKEPIKQIACGSTHTVILTEHGDIYSIGCLYGIVNKLPKKVETRLPMKCIQVAHGRRHVLALMEGGTSGSSTSSSSTSKRNHNARVVVSWGAGHFGQLGQGNEITGLHHPRVIERLLPHAIGGYGVLAIYAGGLSSACIVDTSDGSSAAGGTSQTNILNNVSFTSTRVFAWGYNRRNQCGTEGGKCNTVSQPLPMVDVIEEVEVKTPNTNDRRYSGNHNNSSQELVEQGFSLNESDMHEVRRQRPSLGGSTQHSTTTPTIRYQRQRANFKHLALGRLHTLGLTTSGNVYAWGCTSGGRCGLGEAFVGGGMSKTSSSSSSAIFPKRIAALYQRDIIDLAVGDRHSLALCENGSVYSWGIGAEGQLGQGHTMNLHTPRIIQDLQFSSSLSVTTTTEPTTTISSVLPKLMTTPLRGWGGGGSKTFSPSSVASSSATGGGSPMCCPGTNTTAGATMVTSPSSSLMAKVPFFGALMSGATSGGGGAATAGSMPNSPLSPSEAEVSPTTSTTIAPTSISPTNTKDGSSTNIIQADPATTTTEMESTTSSIPAPKPKPPKPPKHKIVQIFATGSYSAALSSSGDLFTWGYGDAGNLGYSCPKSVVLPLVEPGESNPSKLVMNASSASSRDISPSLLKPPSLSSVGLCSSPSWVRETRSFDSRLNLLLPRRIHLGTCSIVSTTNNYQDNRMAVSQVALGPSHLILLCRELSHIYKHVAPPRTHFELEQELRNNQSLDGTQQQQDNDDSESIQSNNGDNNTNNDRKNDNDNNISKSHSSSNSSAKGIMTSPMKKLSFTASLKQKRRNSIMKTKKNSSADKNGGHDVTNGSHDGTNVRNGGSAALSHQQQQGRAVDLKGTSTVSSQTTNSQANTVGNSRGGRATTATAVAAATSTEDDDELDDENNDHGDSGVCIGGFTNSTPLPVSPLVPEPQEQQLTITNSNKTSRSKQFASAMKHAAKKPFHNAMMRLGSGGNLSASAAASAAGGSVNSHNKQKQHKV